MKNEDTLKTYEKYFERYIFGTVSKHGAEFKVWLEHMFSFVEKDGSILELGTATGRDADYLESLGYRITRSDAVQAAVSFQESQGHKAILLNILHPPKSLGTFDFIFANGVLPHFDTQELTLALKNISSLLDPEGYLVFTVKEGDGVVISEHKMNAPRYFKNWTIEQMVPFLSTHGYRVVEGGHFEEKKKWISFLCQKM